MLPPDLAFLSVALDPFLACCFFRPCLRRRTGPRSSLLTSSLLRVVVVFFFFLPFCRALLYILLLLVLLPDLSSAAAASSCRACFAPCRVFTSATWTPGPPSGSSRMSSVFMVFSAGSFPPFAAFGRVSSCLVLCNEGLVVFLVNVVPVF